MPRFHARDVFALEDKSAFIMAGFIIEGEVKAGMAVSIQFNSTLKMFAEIDRIETVHRPDGNIVCLFFKCSVPDEVTLWETLKIKDQTIEIT